ncbi:uncharacterized protein LOC129598243 [Paramacrobiotus metropolitanus]|uniref:uncharacterized protein LOC129598243 n=1 Tax=Paramacrobiotus metropolitanus TaxID=2943436 RepID=UPI0024456460|nr:uncharacterized protein LOC129598243 [Paramacrobiotus metropolitanus]XP_055352040.1 uncharacterized protein LOC129598243 [Paramacrobiotus metropolitanus]
MAPGTHLWNSVDVMGDDGLLHCGRVVDVTDEGLFIDFLCSNRRREFTPFDRAFLHDGRLYLNRNDLAQTHATFGRTVEVLLRDSASGAWTWFPGELVDRPRDKTHTDYRVVLLHRGTPQEYMDVVPVPRIRRKVSAEGRKKVGSKYRKTTVDLTKKIVDRWTFVKRRSEDLSAAWITTQRNTVMHFRPQNSARAVCVGVEDGCAVYIQRRSDAGDESDDIHARKELNSLRKFHTALLRSLKPEPLVPISISAIDERALLLPELWTDVFSNLDTVTQTRLRPVCAMWEVILSSVDLRPNVVFDTAALSKADMDGCPTSAYFMASVLFKCLSASTKHVAVVDRRRQTSRIQNLQIMEVFDLLSYLTAQLHPGIQLKCVHLFGLKHCLQSCACYAHPNSECGLHQPSNISSSFVNKASANIILACRNLPCDNIQLIKCTITLECHVFPALYGPCVPLSWRCLRSYRQRFTGDLGGALWSALEAGLTVPSGTELARLANWLDPLRAHVQSTGRDKEYSAIVGKVLCAMQTADPRPSLHYRGQKWCVDGLQGLELEKLSRVALRSLIKLMNGLPS